VAVDEPVKRAVRAPVCAVKLARVVEASVADAVTNKFTVLVVEALVVVARIVVKYEVPVAFTRVKFPVPTFAVPMFPDVIFEVVTFSVPTFKTLAAIFPDAVMFVIDVEARVVRPEIFNIAAAKLPVEVIFATVVDASVDEPVV
jgi:hypothetical protein